MHATTLPLTAFLLSTAALASPTPHFRRSGYVYSSAQSFSLVAKITKPAGDIPDNLFVEGAHVAAGQSVASLEAYNYTAGITGRVFYQNGTTDEVIYGNGRVASTGGSPPFPYGWVMYANGTGDKAEDNTAAYINAGIGTPGMGIRYPYTGVAFPEDFPKLGYRNVTSGDTYGNQFYACNSFVYGDIPIIALGWHDDNGFTPEGCAEVTLIPQCGGDMKNSSGVDSQYLQTTPCFTDANGANITELMQGGSY